MTIIDKQYGEFRTWCGMALFPDPQRVRYRHGYGHSRRSTVHKQAGDGRRGVTLEAFAVTAARSPVQ